MVPIVDAVSLVIESAITIIEAIIPLKGYLAMSLVLYHLTVRVSLLIGSIIMTLTMSLVLIHIAMSAITGDV